MKEEDVEDMEPAPREDPVPTIITAQICSGLFGSHIGLWLCTGRDIIMLVSLVVSVNSVLLVFADCGTKCAGKEVGSGAI